MWARVTFYDNAGATETEFDAGLEYFREHLLPVARRTPGWLATLNLATPDRSRSLTISLWASQREMLASEQLAKTTVLAHLPQHSGATAEHYEVTLADYVQRAARS